MIETTKWLPDLTSPSCMFEYLLPLSHLILSSDPQDVGVLAFGAHGQQASHPPTHLAATEGMDFQGERIWQADETIFLSRAQRSEFLLTNFSPLGTIWCPLQTLMGLFLSRSTMCQPALGECCHC
jgi:hypothetical protein